MGGQPLLASQVSLLMDLESFLFFMFVMISGNGLFDLSPRVILSQSPQETTECLLPNVESGQSNTTATGSKFSVVRRAG